MLGKLLGVATVGSTLAGVALLHRFLFDAVDIIILSILTAFMFCILAAGVVCAVYFGLLHYGLDPFAAGIAMGAFIFAVTVICAALTLCKLKRLRDLAHHNMNPAKLGLLDISAAAHAFIDGFLSHKE